MINSSLIQESKFLLQSKVNTALKQALQREVIRISKSHNFLSYLDPASYNSYSYLGSGKNGARAFEPEPKLNTEPVSILKGDTFENPLLWKQVLNLAPKQCGSTFGGNHFCF